MTETPVPGFWHGIMATFLIQEQTEASETENL